MNFINVCFVNDYHIFVSFCSNRFFLVFPRNSKYLETLTDDKETSLQFCVHKNPTTVWKGMEHQFGESENC